MTASDYVRDLRVVLGHHTNDVLARWRQRTGPETSQKKALCEAMIRCEDEWELARGPAKPRHSLREVRRHLEMELYA